MNTRPLKCQRTLSVSASSMPKSSSLTPPPPDSPTPALRPLPPAILLLALPGLLALPPTHPDFGFSLFLSLRSLRQCLAMPALAPDVESRAWTGLAEVGMRVMESGFCSQEEGCDWAVGIHAEVEKALSKGLLIAQKHPSLRPLRHHLTLLHAHFAFTFPSSSTSPKFARAILRRLIASFVPSDPPATVYNAHLTLIAKITTPPPSSNAAANTTPAPLGAPALQAILAAIDTLITLARKNHHPRIISLAHVIRLCVLLRANAWTQVGAALDTAEAVLGLMFDKDGKVKNDRGNPNAIVNAKPDDDALPRWNSITAHDVNVLSREHSQVHITNRPNIVEPKQEESTQSDPAHASLVIHTLLSGTIFFTFSGNIRAAEQRLVALHEIVDSGALEGFKDGIVQIPLPPHPPLAVHTTHPLILLPLTFLVSATAKRDPVGRNPKRRLWAEAAISILNTAREDIELPLWASLADRDEIIQRIVRLTADLLCELIAISIQRSEFDAADSHLNALLTLTYTHDLFHSYSARITLHAAHLAHALGDTERASVCYRVAKSVDDERNARAGYVGAAACAGEALLRIGLLAQAQVLGENSSTSTAVIEDASSDKSDWLDAETHALARSAIQRCHGMGGTLEAVGKVVQAAVAGARGEIVGAKSHLKSALSLSTLAGENHLRALLLAQVGAQYLHTAPAHAMETLAVCETLGAGMGAKQKDVNGGKGKGKEKETENDTDGGNGSIGNAPLRLWVGERFLEIFKRANKPHRVAKQEAYNAMYRGAVEGIVGRARWPSATNSDDEKGPADGEDVKMQDLDPDRDVEM
ncbi:uncharacterized protein BJ212DRAFT_1391745 [Suillus subaureus]|uniref:Uncharacterized protein n=1 Tax=Suillus subaureus TaxID=48587 RepID=A0A9P7DXQ1_9AGAM|nr:uncharacterized protein BJ212DRAFT_1391745 [Suillus subaureus]KAG1805584.1 hypothetical protein BJ212DRAFT_1391745 [Suillus subaureus]